jgi:predicted phage terminase large subunit-like protein
MRFTSRSDAHAFYAETLREAESVGPAEVRAAMAALGRRDLFFLLVYLLKRKDVDREWLFERCCEVQQDPNGHLDLWAREHYKSTLITFGKTIQDILSDPELTVGIFSHTRPIATGFLRQIKREFEGNDLLKDLYPEVLYQNPKKDSPKWTESEGFIVRRKGNPKESTVEAYGLVDGQPTSRHYKLMVYDDVVTKESVYTPDQIRRTTEAWELSLNLGSEGGCKRYIGTRYHFNDTYREIMARGAAKPRIYPATEDGLVEGEPVLLSRETLAEKRRDMGPYTFGCQMLQDPKADEVQGFKEDWLRYWTPKDWAGWNLYILVDPAREKKKENDYTCMLVVGLGPDHNVYVLDMVRDRLNLTERADALIGLHRQYHGREAKVVRVGYEQYGMMADIEHIRIRQGEENYRFPIVALGGPMPKFDRIRRLIPDFEQGRLFLPVRCLYVDREKRQHDLTREFIDEEYLPFPVGVHDDMLDCLARIKDSDFKASFPMERKTSGPRQFARHDYNPLRGVPTR